MGHVIFLIFRTLLGIPCCWIASFPPVVLMFLVGTLFSYSDSWSDLLASSSDGSDKTFLMGSGSSSFTGAAARLPLRAFFSTLSSDIFTNGFREVLVERGEINFTAKGNETVLEDNLWLLRHVCFFLRLFTRFFWLLFVLLLESKGCCWLFPELEAIVLKNVL